MLSGVIDYYISEILSAKASENKYYQHCCWVTKYIVFINKVSTSVFSWCVHCLLLSYRRIIPFLWKIDLWISLHLIHLKEIRAFCQDCFHTHKCVISLPFVVLLFISQLQHQFLHTFICNHWVFSSWTSLPMPGLCWWHHLLTPGEDTKLTARVPRCLRKGSPGRRSSKLQLSMGKLSSY